MTAPAAPATGRLVTPRRLLLSFLLALAAMGVVFAFTEGEDEPPVRTVAGVESVFPAQGQLVLRQDRIIADLRTGFQGVLQIDGVEIPEDQLQRTPELGIVQYTPGPGTETGPLAPGRHTARVVFWDATAGREAGTRSYTWTFQVH